MAETKTSTAPADTAAPAETPQPELKTTAKQDGDERGPRWNVAFGTRSDDVSALQGALNKKLAKDYQLEVDGVFGQTTAAAVKVWQRSEGYPADAVVNEEQAKKLGF
jgi:peptidoglycan hydrolase-like protein with peptidoglycan-binding domain